MEVSSTLKSLDLSPWYGRKDWLLYPMLGLAVTGSAYWYYKNRYRHQGVDCDHDRPRHHTRICFHAMPHHPVEELKENLEVLNPVNTEEEKQAKQKLESSEPQTLSEEDEEVYSILKGTVKKTSSLTENKPGSTKHLSRGDLEANHSQSNLPMPSLAKDLSAGEQGCVKPNPKCSSLSSKQEKKGKAKEEVGVGANPKVIKPTVIKKEAKPNQGDKTPIQESKELKMLCNKKVKEGAESTEHASGLAETPVCPHRQRFRVVATGRNTVITKYGGGMTRFNFND